LTSATLTARKTFSAGRTGIRRRHQHHELPRAQVEGDGVGGGADERQVGLAVSAERRRHAEQNGIALGEPVEIRRGLRAAADERRPHPLVGDVADVARAAAELLGAVEIDVEADDVEAGLGEDQRDRQADVAQTDHADDGGATLDPGEQRLELGGVRFQRQSSSRPAPPRRAAL
jgi:hypothetical protein